MYRYYFFVNGQFTEVYYTDGNKYKKLYFEDQDFVYNTLKYDIDKGLLLANKDRPYQINRFLVFGKDEGICGVEYNQAQKLYVLFKDIIKRFVKQKEFEVCITTGEDLGLVEENAKDLSKMYNAVFAEISKELNRSIRFKGQFLYSRLVPVLLTFLVEKYPAGIVYADDLQIYILMYFKKLKSCQGFSEMWAGETEEKEKIATKLSDYLDDIEFPYKNEEFQRIKEYIFEKASCYEQVEKISIIKRDQEYIIDCKQINALLEEEQKKCINIMFNKIKESRVENGSSILLDFKNKKTYESFINNDKVKELNVLTKVDIDKFKINILVLIDSILKYNANYKYKISTLQFGSIEKKNEELDYHLGFYYHFFPLLNNQQKQDIIKRMGYTKIKR